MSTQPSQTSEQQQVDWKCLRLVMERLQSLLIENDKKMDVDVEQEGQSPDNFTQLIEYLFAALEMAEKRFVEPAAKPTEESSVKMDVELGEEPEEQEDPVKVYLLIELMAINSLLSIYKLNKLSKTLDESKFNIELLMQILQTKRDSSTAVDEHGSATDEYEQDRTNVQENVLLLLSEIGSIFPDKVLEHVLIMFVFVGNKLVRKDDSYSFQIINQIIRTILPSIVNNVADDESNRLNQSNNEMKRHQKKLPFVSSLVCKILQSFVVALPHIPAHRKSIIFDQLLTIVGLDEYLWITSIQSIDYHLVQSNDLLDFKNQIEKLKQNERGGDEDEEALKNEKKLRDQIKSSIQSMISMFVQFEPTNLVQSSVYHLTFLNKYLKSLFDKALHTINSDKPHLQAKKEPVYAHLACQLDNYNLLQMKYLAYNLMTFVSDLLSSEELIMKLAHLYESKSDESIASLFEHLLEKILLLILDLTQMFNAFEQQLKQHKLNATSKMLLDDLRKFHKALLNRSYELMERAINLLDSKQFILVVKSLLKHELVQIRRRVLGLLNNKLRKYEPDEKETTLLIAMIDDLLDSIQLRSDSSNHNEIEINNQTILFSIKLLCKRIGEQNPLAFGKVLKYLSDNLIDKALYVKQDAASSSSSSSHFQKVNLLSSVLLCIGEICLKLKSNTLIYLNKIMIFVLEIVDLISAKLDVNVNKEVEHGDLLNDYQRSDEGNKANLAAASAQFKSLELLILSSVTCLQKIVQHMANFLSPFLQRLLHFSCSMSHLIQTLQQDEQNRSNCAQIESKLALLRSSLAIQIPLRLLAPILSEQSVQQVAAESASKTQMSLKHVQFYMQIVRAAIQKATQEDIVSNIRMLRTMFTNLFDLRTNYAKSMSKSAKAITKKLGKKFESFMTNELSNYENFVIEAFCEFTYKLSEDLFRPIFFKMYEWATANEPPKDRQITFYRATHRLSDKLKSLFVLFAPQFVQHATELLNSLNSSKTDEKYFSTSQCYDKENLLLVSLVDTLSNVFLNDAQRTFVSKERFNLVMEPLVDQIENEFDYGDYRKYVKEHLGPCIANLASCCTQEDTLCRKFNYQILLKTKHSSVQVRLASLDVLNMFSKKLGDLYNSYLSDTMPFLSELMEDPIEEVEDQVQHLISELEDMLGESLQSHLI